MNPQWAFYKPDAGESDRISLGGGTLHLAGKGTTPADSSPLSFVCGDHRYDVQVEIERDANAAAGLILFYNKNLYCGLGFDQNGAILHRYGQERQSVGYLSEEVSLLYLKLRNDKHIVTMFTSMDGVAWNKFDVQIETSGYHHNVAYDFLSLRPAVYCAGAGSARFRNLVYRGL